jgi:hypothetical protein
MRSISRYRMKTLTTKTWRYGEMAGPDLAADGEPADAVDPSPSSTDGL